jgi:hypothetical protein
VFSQRGFERVDHARTQPLAAQRRIDVHALDFAIGPPLRVRLARHTPHGAGADDALTLPRGKEAHLRRKQLIDAQNVIGFWLVQLAQIPVERIEQRDHLRVIGALPLDRDIDTHTRNDSPQPQRSFSRGLWNLKPSFKPSRTKSSSVPSM